MTLANPAGLALLALAVPIVLLHVLKPRRPPMTVSSTWLWRDVARPVTAAAPWQRLRPSLLLFLQLLAVALLALAVAGPARVTAAPLAPHTIFVLDASGSMAAEDGSPDRLAEAKDAARRLRRELPASGVASIVVASPEPRVVLSASGDPRAFSDALRPVRVVPGPADFPTAFTLAASLETPGLPIGFVLLSDGQLDASARAALPSGMRYVRVGERAMNQAITHLVVEPAAGGLNAIVTMKNTGGAATRQTLRLDVDGRTRATVDVPLARGATVEREIAAPDGDRVEAFLEGEDLLAADNRAFAVAGRRPAVRVLHAGPDNAFLDKLLAALPGVSVERSATARPAIGFDLAIYDRVPVPADPAAPVLALATPGAIPGVRAVGTVDGPAITLVRSEDALLAGLDLSAVTVGNAQRLEVDAGEVIVAGEDAPLLVRGTHADHAFLYFAFELAESDLPLQVAFPVIFERLISELTAATVPPPDVRVGQSLPAPTGALVRQPGGASVRVDAGALTVTPRAGVYVISQPGRAERTVAVNVDPAESVIAPVASLPIPEPREGERRTATRGERALLPWVVAALAVVLLGELLLSRRSLGVPRRQWQVGLAVRVVIAAALLGSLLDVALPRRGGGVSTMFLIDASDSMGAGGRDAAIAWVRDALDDQPRNARAGVAFFGGNARLELTVQRRAQLVQPATVVDPTRTDLAGALRLAGAVLPSADRRRVVVVSDGRMNTGDARVEARRLRGEGIRVDVHAIDRAAAPDAAVARVEGPGRAAVNESIELRAVVVASERGPARLALQRDDEVVEERVVELEPGENLVTFRQSAATPGVARFRVRVTTAGDRVPENDVGFGAVEIEGPARVLVAEGTAGEGGALAAALRSGGLVVDVIAAPDLPVVEVLAGYRSIVLVDVDARSLTAAQIASLSVASRELGRGVVVLGGDKSFALGGYRDSALEALLPVVSEVTDPKRRQPVAQVLALDTSGSMGACHCAQGSNGLATGGNRNGGGVNKTDISRAGAARAIAALSATDQVGVLAFNQDQKMVIPLQRVPSDEEVRKGLARLKPEGETDLNAGLKRAASELQKAKARLKHIILFTDGFTAPPNLTELIRQARELADSGVTISVVATGEGATRELAQVAEAGRGRFYPGRDLNEVPEILMQEAVLATRSFVNEGTFFPKVVGLSEAVRDLAAAPPLLGYLATTAKPTASTALRIGDDEDPLLASWTPGLGRVTAWTSDASARWGQQWAAWPGYTAFWSAVVKETFPAVGATGAVLRATVEGDRLRIAVEGTSAWPEGATATARVGSPGRGEGTTVPLERTAGNNFAAEVPAGAPGAYAVGATVSDSTGTIAQLSALATQSYAPEYRPGPSDPAALVAVSRLSGGRGTIAPGRAFDASGLPQGRDRIELAGWLLLLAALLWPVDVALRRLTVRPEAVVWVRTAAPALVTRAVGRLRRAGPASAPSTAPGPAPPAEPSAPTEPAPAEPEDSLGRLLSRKRRAGGDGSED